MPEGEDLDLIFNGEYVVVFVGLFLFCLILCYALGVLSK